MFRTLTTSNFGKNMRLQELIHCLWERKMLQLLWKTFWWFLTKLNTFGPNDPAVAFLNICLKDLRTYVHTKTFTRMFLTALFITVKTWKKPRCFQQAKGLINYGTSKQLNIIQYGKKKKLLSHDKTQRNLKCKLQSERSQPEKTTYYMIPTI